MKTLLNDLESCHLCKLIGERRVGWSNVIADMLLPLSGPSTIDGLILVCLPCRICREMTALLTNNTWLWALEEQLRKTSAMTTFE